METENNDFKDVKLGNMAVIKFAAQKRDWGLWHHRCWTNPRKSGFHPPTGKTTLLLPV